MIIRNLFIILLSFIVFNNVFGQNISKSDTFVNCLNNYFGADDLIMNGDQYTPSNPKIKGNPFYSKSEFSNGTVYIKGRTYPNLLLNYDILHNDLVVVNNSKSLSIAIIANHELIDSFYIFNANKYRGINVFVNLNLVIDKTGRFGYLEQLYKGNKSFYMGYKKRLYSNYSDLTPYGIYSNAIKKLYVLDHGNLVELRGKRAFLKYFKLYKKDLKRFMRKHKIKFKRANSNEYYLLFDYLNKLLSEKK